MEEYDIEFLDILAIVSFALQLTVLDQVSNDDILRNLHADLAVVDTKLNAIMEHLGISLDHSAQSTSDAYTHL